MKTNKKLATSSFCKNVVKKFCGHRITLFSKCNARDTNFFTKKFTNC